MGRQPDEHLSASGDLLWHRRRVCLARPDPDRPADTPRCDWHDWIIWVQTIVDITGHGVQFGSLFDNTLTLVDQRVMWTFLMLVIVFKGAGVLSVDALFRKRGEPAAA